jgi:hypothetical protein
MWGGTANPSRFQAEFSPSGRLIRPVDKQETEKHNMNQMAPLSPEKMS